MAEYVSAPLHVDGRGRGAQTDYSSHLKDMIYAVLFTAPGERVNRPDYGCGLRQLVFEPNGEALATATQFLVQSSLVRWLDSYIGVQSVDVSAVDSRLTVRIAYVERATGAARNAEFMAPGV
jgi:phage baseplate assembly protein W